MRNFKKFLATAIAAVTLAAAMCFGASAAKFTDVNAADKTLAEAVDLLSYLNVTKGTTETTFGTNENVTRQQMAAFIYRLMKKGSSLEGGQNSTTFTDLTDSTYFAYVSWANSLGIIKGRSETVFDPTGTITLQEAYTMVVRALGYDDGTLLFPHGYIDIAEAKEVGLDEGIPSGFSYETPLTRGAVAIILYNAFFAETGYTETEQVERKVGTGAHSEIILVKKEYNPTLAERVYEVEEGEFQVVATPKYAFNENKGSTEYMPLVDEFETDVLQFVAMETGEKIDSFYYEFDKLNLTGNVDDYIMGVFDIFYTIDDDNNIDKIYYAGNAMDHKTATSGEMKKVTGDDVEDYYEWWFNGSTSGSNKIHEPYITISGKKIYFFNAPYSYLKPNYGAETDANILYALRNEENAKLINIELVDAEKETYSYYIEKTFVENDYEEFMRTFHQVASKGIVKFDIYDANGNGIYEYVRYRPYMFGRMEDDDSYTFKDVPEHANNEAVDENNKDDHEYAISKVPTIYYNEANLTGAKFNDGDFVFAYLNPDANELDVYAVLNKTQGTVSYVSSSTGTVKVNGVSFRTCYPQQNVLNYHVGDVADHDTGNSIYATFDDSNTAYHRHLTSAAALDNDYVVYTYKTSYDTVYFFEPMSESGATYSSENIIIPLEASENNGGQIIPEFDVKTGENVFHIKAWVNGDIKYVPVSIEEMYPTPTKSSTIKNAYDFRVDNAYFGKICTYTVDSNGVYTLTSLLYAEDEDGNYDGINDDPRTLVEEGNSEFYGRDLTGEEVRIIKVVGNRYRLVDSLNHSLLGNDTLQRIENMMFTASTKIIIRNEKTGVDPSADFDDRYEYLEYDADSFIGSTAVVNGEYLTNVQYILKGDPDNDDRANLMFLYAETKDFDFVSKTAESNDRILLATYPGTDAEDYYRNYYDIFNPYTGEKIEGVAGSKSFAQAKNVVAQFTTIEGKLAEINAEGEIDETKTSGGVIDVTTNTNLAFVADFSEKDLVLELAPVNSADASYFAGEFYQLAEDTPVTVVKYAKNDTSFYKAEVSKIDAADLASDNKDLKCYNEKMTKPNDDKYYTEYAEFVKCYVDYEPADDPDELPTANYVIVVVHDNEDPAYLDI